MVWPVTQRTHFTTSNFNDHLLCCGCPKKIRKCCRIHTHLYFLLYVQTSAVEISQIMYQNISGTSKSPNVMKFACSDTVPCNHIVVNNINLRRTDGKAAGTFCNNAKGFYYGYVQPSADCLMSSNDSFIKPSEENEVESEYLIHREL